MTSLGVRIGPAKDATGSACPFAQSLAGPAPAEATATDGVAWTPGAEARLAGIPEFVRPMARTGIETFARERGHAAVDEQVMDEARKHFGM